MGGELDSETERIPIQWRRPRSPEHFDDGIKITFLFLLRITAARHSLSLIYVRTTIYLLVPKLLHAHTNTTRTCTPSQTCTVWVTKPDHILGSSSPRQHQLNRIGMCLATLRETHCQTQAWTYTHTLMQTQAYTGAHIHADTEIYTPRRHTVTCTVQTHIHTHTSQTHASCEDTDQMKR